MNRLFLQKRGKVCTPEYSKAVTAMEIRETARYTIDLFGLDETVDDVIAEWHEMAVREYAEHVSLKPYAKELLASLKAHGIRLAVATSSSPAMFTPCLERHGILSLFDSIVTSSDVGVGKSDPAIYLKAASDLGLEPSECAVFEDLPTGLRSASGAGFTCIGVLDDFSLDERDEVISLSEAALKCFSEFFSEKKVIFTSMFGYTLNQED
ncbi:MAG: HAD family hydrolase [Bullifex sp.]